MANINHLAISFISISFFSNLLGSQLVSAETITASDFDIEPNQATDLVPIIEPSQDVLQAQTENLNNNQESQDQTSPQIVPSENIPNILTLILLGDTLVSHSTEWELDSNFSFGSDRSNNFEFKGIAKLESQAMQSVSQDNIFTFDFQGDFFEARTVNQERTVTTTFTEPQTAQGFRLQQTFTGDCSIFDLENAEPNQQCNLLPSLRTAEIDPDFLVPTRFEQNRNLGKPISQETLEILQQPGFQNIGSDGEFIGLDLLFPNTGALPGNRQSQETKVSRREDIDLTVSLRHYDTRQIIKANDERAVLGRTVRGLGLILDEENIFLNTGLTAAGQFLPDVIPDLEGSTEAPNTRVNPNLFFAANNTRLPDNSFAIYQGGLGNAKSGTNEDPNPVAKYHSVWLGLSPVVDRSLTQNVVGFRETSDREVFLEAGGQGGASLGETNQNIGFIADINGLPISSANPSLNNFFIQNFISFLRQDVDLITEQVFQEKTSYYPHLSFTGNVTNTAHVFRYYSGVIADDRPKFYLGADYNHNINGWRFQAGAIGYTNPDRDYFSKLDGSIGRRWELNANTNFSLSTRLRYAIDRPPEGRVLDDPVDNEISLGATLNTGPLSLNVRQLFDILPDSTGNQIRAGVGLQLGDRAAINAFIIPQRNIDNIGINGEYQFSRTGLFRTLVLQWERRIFEFGEDSFGNELKEANDTFSILLNFSGS